MAQVTSPGRLPPARPPRRGVYRVEDGQLGLLDRHQAKSSASTGSSSAASASCSAALTMFAAVHDPGHDWVDDHCLMTAATALGRQWDART
jgi:hypothetical protein